MNRFEERLSVHRLALRRARLQTLQVNVGRTGWRGSEAEELAHEGRPQAPRSRSSTLAWLLLLR